MEKIIQAEGTASTEALNWIQTPHLWEAEKRRVKRAYWTKKGWNEMRVELSRRPMMKGCEHQAISLGAMMWPPASNMRWRCSPPGVRAFVWASLPKAGLTWVSTGLLTQCWSVISGAGSGQAWPLLPALLPLAPRKGSLPYCEGAAWEGVTCRETEASGRQPLYEGGSVEGSCSSRQTFSRLQPLTFHL